MKYKPHCLRCLASYNIIKYCVRQYCPHGYSSNYSLFFCLTPAPQCLWHNLFNSIKAFTFIPTITAPIKTFYDNITYTGMLLCILHIVHFFVETLAKTKRENSIKVVLCRKKKILEQCHSVTQQHVISWSCSSLSRLTGHICGRDWEASSKRRLRANISADS